MTSFAKETMTKEKIYSFLSLQDDTDTPEDEEGEETEEEEKEGEEKEGEEKEEELGDETEENFEE